MPQMPPPLGAPIQPQPNVQRPQQSTSPFMPGEPSVSCVYNQARSSVRSIIIHSRTYGPVRSENSDFDCVCGTDCHVGRVQFGKPDISPTQNCQF